MSKKDNELLKLDRVLGLSSLNNASFKSASNGDLFYIAGCVVVQYNPTSNKQVGFFNVGNAISCIAISKDDQLLAIGERGHKPRITLWSIALNAIIITLSYHDHGVGTLAFSPNNRFLVSVGFKHDKRLALWDLNKMNINDLLTDLCNETPSASKNIDLESIKPVHERKLGNKVHCVTFCPRGTYFVTGGERHIKYWHLHLDKISGTCETLTGKSAMVITRLSESTFMDVLIASSYRETDVSGKESKHIEDVIYVASSDGILCSFWENGILDKWVTIETDTCYSIALYTPPESSVTGTITATSPTLTPSKSVVLVGCAEGVIRAFYTVSLQYVSTLPLPAPLNKHSEPESLRYGACYGLTVLQSERGRGIPYVAAAYGDRSMFIWDISIATNVTRYRTFTYHRACVWDIGFMDTPASNTSSAYHQSKNTANKDRDTITNKNNLPPGTFVTCSADGSIRFWNLSHVEQRNSYWKSPYSREMLHSIELSNEDVGQGLNPIDITANATDSVLSLETIKTQSSKDSSKMVKEGMIDMSAGIPNSELPSRIIQDLVLAPRALAVHPNGLHLACGDKNGKLRIYDTTTMTCIHDRQSHSAEILTLHFSPVLHKSKNDNWSAAYDASKSISTSTQEDYLCLLASAGRDRLVHIYDASRSYRPTNTLDNHSSSITTVRFTLDGKRFLSCGGDKTMCLSNVNGTDITRIKTITTPQGTINGLSIEATNRFAVSSGQDKRLNIWNVITGKHVRMYRPPSHKLSNIHEYYKNDIDPSGMFVACSAFDKSINLFDFFSGELLYQVMAHSELVTNVKFSMDGKQLISVGGDGCIFVWKVSDVLVIAMQERLVELYNEALQKQVDIMRKSQSLSLLKKSREKKNNNSVDMTVSGALPPPPGTDDNNSNGNSNVTSQDTSNTGSTGQESIAPPPPPAEAVNNKRGVGGKWASRQEDGYALFGQQINLNAPQLQEGKQLNKFTLEMTGMTGMSYNSNASLTGNTTPVSPGTIMTASPRGISDNEPNISNTANPMSPTLAHTIEADDDVMMDDLSEVDSDLDSVSLDLEEDEDEMERSFFSANRARSDSLSESKRDKNGPGVKKEAEGGTVSASDITQEEEDVQREIAALRKSADVFPGDDDSMSVEQLEQSILDDDLRASQRLDQLEASMDGLESWLEGKLRGDLSLDATSMAEDSVDALVTPVIGVSNETDHSEGQAESSSTKPSEDAAMSSDGAITSHKEQGQGQESEQGDTTNTGVDNETKSALLVSKSLSSAYFLEAKHGAVGGGCKASDLLVSASVDVGNTKTTSTTDSAISAASAPEARHATASGGSNAGTNTIGNKRRQTAAAVAQMKDRLRGMGLIKGLGVADVGDRYVVETESSQTGGGSAKLVTEDRAKEDGEGYTKSSTDTKTSDSILEESETDSTTIDDKVWYAQQQADLNTLPPPPASQLKVNESLQSISLTASTSPNTRPTRLEKRLSASVVDRSQDSTDSKELTAMDAEMRKSTTSTSSAAEEELREHGETADKSRDDSTLNFEISASTIRTNISTDLKSTTDTTTLSNRSGNVVVEADADTDDEVEGDENSNVLQSSIENSQRVEKVDNDIVRPMDGEITTPEAERAMARSQINAYMQAQATQDAGSSNDKNTDEKEDEKTDTTDSATPSGTTAGVPKVSRTPARRVVNRREPHLAAGIPTSNYTAANDVSRSTPTSTAQQGQKSTPTPSTSLSISSPQELTEKVQEYNSVLKQLNDARDAALRSYHELVQLKGGLQRMSTSQSLDPDAGLTSMDNSISFMTTSTEDGNSVITLGGIDENEAESALSVAEDILTEFRHSLSSMPFKATSGGNKMMTPANTATSSSSSSGIMATVHEEEGHVSDLSSSPRSMTNTNLSNTSTIAAGHVPVFTDTTASTTSVESNKSYPMSAAGTVNMDELLEQNADKLMEKIMAKLAANGMQITPSTSTNTSINNST